MTAYNTPGVILTEVCVGVNKVNLSVQLGVYNRVLACDRQNCVGYIVHTLAQGENIYFI